MWEKLLVGVLNRVDELADREFGFVPPRAIPYKSVIPLEEVIAETLGVGTASKKVATLYEQMVRQKPEFEILLDLTEEEIVKLGNKEMAESIIRVRNNQVRVEGGYDGVFGKIHIYDDDERDKLLKKPKQPSLF